MRISNTIKGCFIILMAWTCNVSAETPQVLKGSWILDAEATEKQIKSSPSFKAEDEKYLPAILKRMSLVSYTFTETAITVAMRGKEQIMPVVLKEHEAAVYIFEGKAGEDTVTMTVRFIDEETINIRSSATDDMDHYLWKRGQIGETSSE